MTRYRYSRKQIVRWIEDRDWNEPSWYLVNAILERLAEKSPARSEERKLVIKKLETPHNLAEMAVVLKLNEIIDYLNSQ